MHINYYLWKKCCYLAVGCNDISNRYNVFCACHHKTNIHNKPLKTIDNPFTIKSAHSPTDRTNDRKITNKIHKNNEHECTMYEYRSINGQHYGTSHVEHLLHKYSIILSELMRDTAMLLLLLLCICFTICSIQIKILH